MSALKIEEKDVHVFELPPRPQRPYGTHFRIVSVITFGEVPAGVPAHGVRTEDDVPFFSQFRLDVMDPPGCWRTLVHAQDVADCYLVATAYEPPPPPAPPVRSLSWLLARAVRHAMHTWITT